MPQSIRRLRERRRETARRARAMESEEARAARLKRDATRMARRRADETDEARAARLADNTEREARRRARAMESEEARAARLKRDATREARRRAAETDEARAARLADNTEREARRRAEQTDERMRTNMVMSFRVSELQVLLGFAGQNKSGRKHELLTRALHLLRSDTSPSLRVKVQELYRRRYPRRSVSSIAVASGTGATTPARNLEYSYLTGSVQPQTVPTAHRYDAESRNDPLASLLNHPAMPSPPSGLHGAPTLTGVPTKPTMTPPRGTALCRVQAPIYQPSLPLQLTTLPFYDVLDNLVKARELVCNNDQRFQEMYVAFVLTPQHIALLTECTEYPVDKTDCPVQVQMRFCMAGMNEPQDDNYPPNLCIKVNGKPCVLPGFLPPSKNGAEPRRISRPVNVTPYIRLSTTAHNHIGLVWTSTMSKSYAMSLSLVRHLTADALLQRLKDESAQAAEQSQALVMEKLTPDPDCDITTTSLRVSLVCPLGKVRMSVPCRSRHCTHLQCFDAALFIQMNERKPTWLCPVCDCKAPYSSLIIDKFFVDILQVSGDTEEVQFGPDGSWVPVRSKKDGPNPAGANDCRTGCGQLEQSYSMLLGSGTDGAQELGEAETVVDLTVDSSGDESESPPAKKLCGGSPHITNGRVPIYPGNSPHAVGLEHAGSGGFLSSGFHDVSSVFPGVPPFQHELQALYYGRPRIKREVLQDTTPPPLPINKLAQPNRLQPDADSSTGLELFSLLQGDLQASHTRPLSPWQHFGSSLSSLALGLPTSVESSEPSLTSSSASLTSAPFYPYPHSPLFLDPLAASMPLPAAAAAAAAHLNGSLGLGLLPLSNGLRDGRHAAACQHNHGDVLNTSCPTTLGNGGGGGVGSGTVGGVVASSLAHTPSGMTRLGSRPHVTATSSPSAAHSPSILGFGVASLGGSRDAAGRQRVLGNGFGMADTRSGRLDTTVLNLADIIALDD
uniref:E3 SUMO-protein ligase PIAS1-like isoform X3 n=1 Tax=Myxine glutinosa TaxID=7769 RepID=UPI00358EFC24